MTDPRIERMIEEARKQASLTPSATRDLREAIESSPYLSDLMVKAMDAGVLNRIRFDPPSNEGGHYDAAEQTISVNSSLLAGRRQMERVDQLTGVLGHETGHALMARSTELSAYRLTYEIDGAIKDAAQYGDSTVDITRYAQTYVAASRLNEGFAEMAGMNAVASRVRNTVPGAEVSDVLLRLDSTTPCVTDGKLEPGIRLGPGFMQLTGGSIMSPAVEAAAICQFDKSAGTLGLHGNADYNTYYVTYVVSTGAALLHERGQATSQPLPHLGMNMRALGTSAEEIEQAGVSLGGQGRVLGLMDTSGDRPLPVEIKQVGPPVRGQPTIVPDNHASPGILADNPAHADHPTFNRIHDWVKGTGNWNETESRNVSAALYKQQLENPIMQRVDNVTGGLGKDGAHNVIAVYAPFGDKGPYFHAHVDGRQAAQQPAEQSLQQAEVLQQSQDRQLTQERSQQQEQAATMTR